MIKVINIYAFSRSFYPKQLQLSHIFFQSVQSTNIYTVNDLKGKSERILYHTSMFCRDTGSSTCSSQWQGFERIQLLSFWRRWSPAGLRGTPLHILLSGNTVWQTLLFLSHLYAAPGAQGEIWKNVSALCSEHGAVVKSKLKLFFRNSNILWVDKWSFIIHLMIHSVIQVLLLCICNVCGEAD